MKSSLRSRPSLARLVSFALVALTLTSTGCFRTYVYSETVKPQPVTHVRVVHTFIYGIVNLRQVDVDEWCGGAGIQSVYSRLGGLGILGAALTAGLWVPMTVSVTCAEGPGTVGEAAPEDASTAAPVAEAP